jgi:hypothetical protein
LVHCGYFDISIVQPTYGLSDIWIRYDGLHSHRSDLVRLFELEGRKNNPYEHFDSCVHMQQMWYYLQCNPFLGGTNKGGWQ